ncbi:MAG: sodium-dependent transporter [Pseudomonadota bacterium]
MGAQREERAAPGGELFSSRLALLLTTLGMAVGTGNIWRFPRIVAKCGGGAFLIPWLIFLFAWSIPLLVLELGMGRQSRRGCVGAFASFAGKKLGFLGTFVAFTCSAIMFYYAVVAGWCLRYLQLAARGALHGLSGEGAEQAFLGFSGSWEPVIYQVLAMALAGGIVLFGVVRGIERANKVLIPALFTLLFVALGRSLTLPGAGEGLKFLFTVDWPLLADANTWIEGLCQSAWSTGAGWGLMLTYGVYVSRRESVVQNAIFTGLGNNFASIIAAMAIIPAVFALAPAALGPERLAELGGTAAFLTSGGPASTGLTFIWIPALFERMPAGSLFTALFFLTLFFAALSSLIAMVELAARVLIDMGVARRPAVLLVAGAGIVLGIPSAINLTFFQNQDWAWGLGLMLSGLFVALAVVRYGLARFRADALSEREGRLLERAFDYWILFAIPAQFVVMLGWWFQQSVSWDPQGWYNPFGTFTVGTALAQWAVALGVFAGVNRWLVGRSGGEG